MKPDLDTFFQFCNKHLKRIEAIETDEGEEFLFDREPIGGYDFDSETYYINDNNPKAAKLLAMWQLYTS